MALVKETFKQSIYSGLYNIFVNQSAKGTSGDENENPEDVIEQIASDMATVISDAVDEYIKSGDITVSASHISVSASTGACTVTPLAPAKIK